MLSLLLTIIIIRTAFCCVCCRCRCCCSMPSAFLLCFLIFFPCYFRLSFVSLLLSCNFYFVHIVFYSSWQTKLLPRPALLSSTSLSEYFADVRFCSSSFWLLLFHSHYASSANLILFFFLILCALVSFFCCRFLFLVSLRNSQRLFLLFN